MMTNFLLTSSPNDGFETTVIMLVNQIDLW